MLLLDSLFWLLGILLLVEVFFSCGVLLNRVRYRVFSMVFLLVLVGLVMVNRLVLDSGLWVKLIFCLLVREVRFFRWMVRIFMEWFIFLGVFWWLV